MTLSILINDFLDYLELKRNASPLTIKNYDHYLRRFLDFAKDCGPKEIDLDLVRKYRLFLSKKPLKKVTKNYFLIALRSFLRFLARIDVDSLSYEKVELWEVEPRPVKVLKRWQLVQLLQAPDTSSKQGLRDRAIMEVLFSTGLRVSQVSQLNRNSLNLERGVLGRYLKIRKDSFKPLFIRYQGKVDPTNLGEAMRLSARSIERVVAKYVKKIRLPIKATPHTLSLSKFGYVL